MPEIGDRVEVVEPDGVVTVTIVREDGQHCWIGRDDDGGEHIVFGR